MARTCAVAAVTSATVLAAGCAASGPQTTVGRPASPSEAGTAPGAGMPGWSASPSAAATTPGAGTPGLLEALGDRYLTIAAPANHSLDHEVNDFAVHQRADLAAAASDLRAQAATERWFDRRLAAIPFPPGIAAIARALIQVNESRAALAGQQALSASLTALRAFAGQHRAADAAVEFGVRLIREALGLPPPSES
jgi:hypothetical protein